MKFADSYAAINYFDGLSGQPLHGPASQEKRDILKRWVWRAYEEIDICRMAARAEAQFADEQKVIADEQAAKVIEIKDAMNVLVEECRGLKDMNDLMSMNAEYLITLLERAADEVALYIVREDKSLAPLEKLVHDINAAIGEAKK